MIESKNPLISVLMPVYNGAEFLAEAIDSILQQTYGHFEFLIINDGSTDASELIIESYDDPRIVYVKNEVNQGLIYSLNKVIGLSKGKYIARMDADDVSNASRFEKQVAEFERDMTLVVCGSFIKTFGNGKVDFVNHIPVTHPQIVSSVFYRCPFAHPTVMIRKDSLLKLEEFYREDYKHSEDYDLWSRLVFLGTCKNIPEFLLNYRVHGRQVSTVFEELKYISVSRIQYNLLIQIGINPSPRDVFFFLNFYKGISNKDVSYLRDGLNFLENFHRQFNLYQPHLIRDQSQLLISRWFKICGNSGLGFLNLRLAFQLDFFQLKYLKFLDFVKLAYKSLMGYSQLNKNSI
jgi:glycosyltransferase involved in cell wall biosynthesis